jgi:chitin synthase
VLSYVDQTNDAWERVSTSAEHSEPRSVTPQAQISDPGKHEVSVHEPGAPSDADLEDAIREVLQTANLMSVTKRDVRRILEKRFQTDLGPRSAIINAFIDRALVNLH